MYWHQLLCVLRVRDQKHFLVYSVVILFYHRKKILSRVAFCWVTFLYLWIVSHLKMTGGQTIRTPALKHQINYSNITIFWFQFVQMCASTFHLFLLKMSSIFGSVFKDLSAEKTMLLAGRCESLQTSVKYVARVVNRNRFLLELVYRSQSAESGVQTCRAGNWPETPELQGPHAPGTSASSGLCKSDWKCVWEYASQNTVSTTQSFPHDNNSQCL